MKKIAPFLLLAFLGCRPQMLQPKPGNPDWGVQVTWHGHSCFSLKDSIGRTIVIDPFDDTVGYDPLQLKADAVFITHDHFDHNFKKAVRPHFQNLDLVNSTGTISVAADLLVTGQPLFHDNDSGKIHGINRAYTFFMGGLLCAHVGDLGEFPLSEEKIKLLGPVDVLFIPVGGMTTINGAQAKLIVDQIKPKVIFPMHYGDIRFFKLEPLDNFIKLFPPEQVKRLDQSSIRIQKSELGKDPAVYVLTATEKNY